QALAQLAGGMAKPLHELREDLLNLLADVEAALDFSDEDIHFVEQAELLKRLTKGLALATLLRRQLDQRRGRDRPVRVGLAGRADSTRARVACARPWLAAPPPWSAPSRGPRAIT